MQFSFMLEETTDVIFILRQLQEKYLVKKKDLYLTFVNMEKAFDGVPRDIIRWTLTKLCVEEWLICFVL